MRRSIVLLALIAVALAVVPLAPVHAAPAQANFVNYQQCFNGAPPSTSLACPNGWNNGTLQSNNSHYREDDSVPQRLAVSIPDGQPTTGRTVVLRYQTRKGGATDGTHAYDSLTTWNLTQTAANGCQSLNIPICAGGNPNGPVSQVAIPADGVAVPPCGTGCANATTSTHQRPGVMTMYGGTITNIAYGGTVGNAVYPPHDNANGGGDDYATITITYSIPNIAGADSVLLLFGGHLAPSGGPRSWGTGLGAANISGGPYHIKLAGLDNLSAGNRDNQIQASAILGFASITSTKTASPNPANVGATVTYTITLSNSGNTTGTTNVTDDYDQTHIQLNVNSINPPATTVDTTNGVITWNNVSVPPGVNTVTLTYSGTVFGTFGGDHGTCGPTQFPVINNVTLSNGAGTSATLCVNGQANIVSSKSVTPNPANVGQVVTYTITLTNNGNIPGTTNVVDDYDQNHIQLDVNSISPTPTSVDTTNGKITWNNITVTPGTPVILTYQGTVYGTFTGGNGTCNPGQFPVINNVDLSNGTDTSATLCVNANPVLTLTKDTATTNVSPGGTITYTLTYGNTGNAEATNVIITDTLPAGTTFNSCGPTPPGCSQNGNTITWTIASIPPGTTGAVTLTVNVVNPTGCQLCNQASIKIGQNGTQTFSNNKCVNVVPIADPSGAHAWGNATGANVVSSLLGLDLTLPGGNDGTGDNTSVDSLQSGLGSDSENNQVLTVDVPPPAPGSVLHADVLRGVTTSTVTGVPAEATDVSVGSAANVDILGGTVKATLVRGVANAVATGTSITVNSLSSAIEGLEILGVPQAVYPGARVDLPAAVFGPDSYVAIYEEFKNTATPAGTSGGTYSGTITVNMIRVHVTNMLLVGAVEVVVGHATAHADFPQITLCGAQASQSVSGSAFMARALTDPSIAPVIVGAVEIPSSGGAAQNAANFISIDPFVTSKAATSSSIGSFTSLNSTSSSAAEVKSLCVLNTPTGCTVKATLVRAQANSTATGTSRTSDSVGTDFVNLKVGTLVVNAPVPPNTVIGVPGLALVILNEQFCDNGGTLASNCSNGTVAGHTGITVRAIHVIILDPAAGGTPGVDIIVAEAHSDARFV